MDVDDSGAILQARLFEEEKGQKKAFHLAMRTHTKIYTYIYIYIYDLIRNVSPGDRNLLMYLVLSGFTERQLVAIFVFTSLYPG